MGCRSGTTQSFEAIVFSGTWRARVQADINHQIIHTPTGGTFEHTYTQVRRGSLDAELFEDGVSVGTNTVNASTAMPNGEVYLLAENNIGSGANAPTLRRVTCAAYHLGLTANEAADYYAAVSKYNTALSR